LIRFRNADFTTEQVRIPRAVAAVARVLAGARLVRLDPRREARVSPRARASARAHTRATPRAFPRFRAVPEPPARGLIRPPKTSRSGPRLQVSRLSWPADPHSARPHAQTVVRGFIFPPSHLARDFPIFSLFRVNPKSRPFGLFAGTIVKRGNKRTRERLLVFSFCLVFATVVATVVATPAAALTSRFTPPPLRPPSSERANRR